MDKKTLCTFIKELHSPTNTRLYYTNIAIIVILFIVLFLGLILYAIGQENVHTIFWLGFSINLLFIISILILTIAERKENYRIAKLLNM